MRQLAEQTMIPTPREKEEMMKLPFISRKKYETLLADFEEMREQFEDYLGNEHRKDREHREEIQVLRHALFHKGRADDYEKLMLKRAETRLQPPFIPDQSILDVLATSRNETAKQIAEVTGIDDPEMNAQMSGKAIIARTESE